MMLNKLHRISALIIGTFIVVHLVNHLCIINGVQPHIDFMESIRKVYRNIFVESVLLTCILFQIISGLYFVWRGKGKHSGFLEKTQVLSGLYLAYFFLNHIGAVFYGRIFEGLDTNIYFGIAGFHNAPFHLYFIPYYFLAIVAVFLHIACGFYWLSRNRISSSTRIKLTYVIIATGVIIAFTLILGFNGYFGEISIPDEYNVLYQ